MMLIEIVDDGATQELEVLCCGSESLVKISRSWDYVIDSESEV